MKTLICITEIQALLVFINKIAPIIFIMHPNGIKIFCVFIHSNPFAKTQFPLNHILAAHQAANQRQYSVYISTCLACSLSQIFTTYGTNMTKRNAETERSKIIIQMTLYVFLSHPYFFSVFAFVIADQNEAIKREYTVLRPLIISFFF